MSQSYHVLTITAHTTVPTARCPRCGESSPRIHRDDTRRPRDLPLWEDAVRLVLHVRRFRGVNATCTTQPCTERLPQIVRPGGQLGPEGQTRALLPVEAVEVVIPVKPERGSRCQHPLPGEDPQPQRHQVTEMPPIKPAVTEYQLHRLVCPACGAATRAELPADVPAGEFGPRVQAITARCTGAYHLSKRTTQSVLEDLFGVSMGLGSIANLEQATAQVLAEPVAEARAYVQAQSSAYLDETG